MLQVFEAVQGPGTRVLEVVPVQGVRARADEDHLAEAVEMIL